MKGLSAFIAAILLIALVISVGAIIAVWFTGFIKEQATLVGEKTKEEIECQYGGIRVLTETIKCNFSGNGTSINPEYLNFSIENSGKINLYNLIVQIHIQGLTESFDLLEAGTNLSFTENYPLKPAWIKTVFANITKNLPLSDADWLRVITQCANVDSGRIFEIDCTP